jgi:hypothetical protein
MSVFSNPASSSPADTAAYVAALLHWISFSRFVAPTFVFGSA